MNNPDGDCYRRDEGTTSHPKPEHRTVKYFCSDTVAFQQFLQLVLKRTLPALAVSD